MTLLQIVDSIIGKSNLFELISQHFWDYERSMRGLYDSSAARKRAF